MVRGLVVINLQLKWCVGSVTAALAIANIVKSSLGPLGLDKMLVDNIGVRTFRYRFKPFFLTFIRK
jgi:hypothetical protein